MKQATFLGASPSGDSDPSGGANPSGEADGTSAATPAPPRGLLERRKPIGLAALAAGLVLVAFVAGLRVKAERPERAAASPVGTGGIEEATLVIETRPAGWHVWDGEVDRGVTPLTLTLPSGARRLSLRRGKVTRDLAVDLVTGSRTVHHLELEAPAPSIGDLRIETIPPGATVAVDGIGRGVTPVDVFDLKAGRHVVTLIKGDGVISQQVTVEAGARGSLVVPLAGKAAPAVGWLSLKSPVELEVFEGDSLVGSSRNSRLLFLPGRHTLRLVNRELGVEVEKAVDVQAGLSSTTSVALPPGRVSLNARPWAEVLMDGVRIGETPIADREVPLGSHELVFRHPTLGEQRRTIVVTLNETVRLGVDLRR